MSDAAQVWLVIMLTLCPTLLILGILFLRAWVRVQEAKVLRVPEKPQETSRVHMGTEPWIDAPEVREKFRKPEKSHYQRTDLSAPLPLDPKHPPSVLRYNPQPGSQPIPACVCHGRVPVPGQELVLWPVVKNDEVVDTKVFCSPGGSA